jgi:Calcineurin-like phosphoesterase
MAQHPRSGPSEEFLALSYRESKRWRRLRLLVISGTLGLLSLAVGWTIFRADPLEAKKQGFATSPVRYAWVQLMSDDGEGRPGGRLLRAIVLEGDRCPTVREDYKIATMRRRPAPVRTAFPVLLCEAELGESSAAQLGNWMVPKRPAEPNDIVVMGDTGCRMTYYSQDQSCLDKNDWPFRKIASSATAKISDGSFILHLGDFHYREHPCADSSSVCGGSPYGDNWETWETEFFEPAGPLLRAAPWVIMRGNHEDCNRAGAGWLFFFGLPGQKKSSDACESEPTDYTNYNVSIGHTDERPPRARILRVLDTSDERNPRKILLRRGQYEEALRPVFQKTPGEAVPEYWLALHQPLWGRKTDAVKPGEAADSAISAIREKFEARQNERLARLALGGDTHLFQFFWPKTALTPFQIVAGNGGTQLEKETFVDEEIKSYGVEGSSVTLVQHGFTLLQRDRSTWTATQFDSNGGKIGACRFSESLTKEATDPPSVCDRKS